MLMNFLILLFRLVTAVIIPLGAAVFSYLALRMAGQDQPGLPAIDQTCLKCGQTRPGALGTFAYTRGVDRLRRQMRKKQPLKPELSNTETESHFICDLCARRYLRQEILLQTLMVLPYPMYVIVINVFSNQNERFPNILLEAFLIVLAIAGTLAALNLYRALHSGKTPLAEIRDRVAIQERKKELGKDLSYYTRAGMQNLKE